MKHWYVYIVRCKGGSLYTGITKDVAARVKAHNAGKGAAYTRSHRPVKLVWQERKASGTNARKREAEIKSWTKARKERLVSRGQGV